MKTRKQEFWKDTAKMAVPACFVLAFIWQWEHIGSYLMRALVLDVASVTVPDHPTHVDPMLTIYRQIKLDNANISSRMTIRTARSIHVCSAVSPTNFRYQKAAGLENPLPNRMSHWLWSKAALDNCLSTGRYGEGVFYLTTCHTYRWLGSIPLLENCVRSNYYRRGLPLDKGDMQ